MTEIRGTELSCKELGQSPPESLIKKGEFAGFCFRHQDIRQFPKILACNSYSDFHFQPSFLILWGIKWTLFFCDLLIRSEAIYWFSRNFVWMWCNCSLTFVFAIFNSFSRIISTCHMFCSNLLVFIKFGMNVMPLLFRILTSTFSSFPWIM
jgi:hypothetical protein